jgi:hypothetical protein
MARWNHTDPFPNSEVKRCCGDDSLGVAPCQNSSMPGLLFNNIASSIYLEGVLFFHPWINCGNESLLKLTLKVTPLSENKKC